MNRLLKSLLRTGLTLLDQSEDTVTRVRERVHEGADDLAERARHTFRGQQNLALRYAVSFAAGIGLGVGFGMLFAPASGENTRRSIVGKAQDISDKVGERFSSESGSAPGA